jgi:uncharacterized protein YcaQ
MNIQFSEVLKRVLNQVMRFHPLLKKQQTSEALLREGYQEMGEISLKLLNDFEYLDKESLHKQNNSSI